MLCTLDPHDLSRQVQDCLSWRGVGQSPISSSAASLRDLRTNAIEAADGVRERMRRLTLSAVLLAASLCGSVAACAQSRANLAALAGLAPFAALPATPAGRAALAANLRVTGDIQTGARTPPLLVPFAQQEEQALRDAFITIADLGDLADGLGTTLGPVWRAHGDYSAPKTYATVSPEVTSLLAYTLAIVEGDSQAAKYFFANETIDGTTPVSPAAAALITREHGTADVFGRSYGVPAGSAGANPFGDSRPYQTEHRVRHDDGTDYFRQPSSNTAYLSGPTENLIRSPAFPSGHTAYGVTGALLLGFLVPDRFPQEIARATEYGLDRVVLGAHYAMDVIGGRTLAYYDIAQLLANDSDYVGQKTRRGGTVTDYPAALAAARRTALPVLAQGCATTLSACAASDRGRFHDGRADATLVTATLGFGLPVVHAATAGGTEDVAARAPEAGRLLTAAFPWLTLAQADGILTATEGPGGGFLDDGSRFGLYSRLDLYAAGERALALQ